MRLTHISELPKEPEIGEQHTVDGMLFAWSGIAWVHRYEVFPEENGQDSPKNPYAQH